jgi:hypothetical protein
VSRRPVGSSPNSSTIAALASSTTGSAPRRGRSARSAVGDCAKTASRRDSARRIPVTSVAIPPTPHGLTVAVAQRELRHQEDLLLGAVVDRLLARHRSVGLERLAVPRDEPGRHVGRVDVAVVPARGCRVRDRGRSSPRPVGDLVAPLGRGFVVALGEDRLVGRLQELREQPTGLGEPPRPSALDLRTVTGPTDHVVVVGAGLGGLSAALRLAGAGREVTVLEREAVPGRACRPDRGRRLPLRHRPDRADDARPHRRRLRLRRRGARGLARPRAGRPAVPRLLPRRLELDVQADVDAMADEIERVIGPDEAAGYRATSTSSPSSTATRCRLHRPQHRLPVRPADAEPGPARRHRRVPPARPKVEQYLKDPRTQRVFSFQAMYAGLSPTTRSPSTRSSPTWTRWPASTSPRAACTPSRARWPGPPRSTA